MSSGETIGATELTICDAILAALPASEIDLGLIDISLKFIV